MLDVHDYKERVGLGFLLDLEHVFVLRHLDNHKLLEPLLEEHFNVPQQILVYVNTLGAGVILVLLEADRELFGIDDELPPRGQCATAGGQIGDPLLLLKIVQRQGFRMICYWVCQPSRLFF